MAGVKPWSQFDIVGQHGHVTFHFIVMAGQLLLKDGHGPLISVVEGFIGEQPSLDGLCR